MKAIATFNRESLVGFAVLVLCLMSLSSIGQQQQPYNIPTDMVVLPYDVDEMVSLIEEAYTAPVQTNEYVQMLNDHQDFPSLTLGEPLKKSDKKALTQWVETHPASIEALLIARKKNHDTYFNSQSTGNNQ